MTNLYMGGEDLPDDYTDENGAEYNIDNKENVDRDTHDHDMTYENEGKRDLSPMVRISVAEYDKLRDQIINNIDLFSKDKMKRERTVIMVSIFILKDLSART